MRLRIHTYMLIFLLLAASPGLDGKELSMRLYTTENGLSNSCVNDIIQDSNGFLWIATSNGLNRFDGSDFKVLLQGTQIRCLYEDSKGNIWAGLLDGSVRKYDPLTAAVSEYICYFPTESSKGEVSGIIESDDGYLWITVDRLGLVRLNPETGGHVIYENDPEDPASLSNNAVTDLSFDKAGRLWITTWGGGLNVFDPATGTFTRPMESLGIPAARYSDQFSILADTDGVWWIGTTFNGVFRFDSGNSSYTQFSEKDNSLPSNAVLDIAADSSGNIWIGTAEGIGVYEKESAEMEQVTASVNNRSLKSFNIRCLFCDRDNSMWIGTPSGLLLYNSRRSMFGACLLSDEYADTGTPKAVLKDRSGRIWFTDKRGLTRITYDSDGSVEESDLTSFLPNDLPGPLFEDSKGDVWICYSSGRITGYNPSTNRFKNFLLRSEKEDGFPFRSVNSIYEDIDGTLWLGSEVGLMNFDPRTGVCTDLFRSKSLIYPAEKVMGVIRDRDGNLWVATYGGVLKYSRDLQSMKIFHSDSEDGGRISSNFVECIFQDSGGIIWAGTPNGLNRYDPDKDSFVLVDNPEEAVATQVVGILEDEDKALWILTGNGLLRYCPTDGSVRIFGEEDGLLGKEFIKGAYWKSKDGEIILGSVNGVNRFYPNSITIPSFRPSVFIEDFQIFNRTVLPGDDSVLSKCIEYTDEISLSHRQSMVSFRFSAIDFITPLKEHYEYWLEGVDADWVATSPDKKYASYANLTPGSYVFKVRARTGNSISDEGYARVRLVIRHPFWATWWAYVIYVLLAGGAVAAVMAFLLKRQKMRNKHEMDELKLKLFTNISHEFRTSLTLILGPLDYLLNSGGAKDSDRRMLSMMKGNADRLLRLVNQLLDFRKVEARKMTINNSTQDIVAFVRDVYELFGQYAKEKDLEYTFSSEIPEYVMDFDKDKVDKVIYNLLSNAFKYTDSGGKVDVGLDSVEKDRTVYVSIKVSDNGIGMSDEAKSNLFQRFYQASDDESRFRGGSGLGLNMTWELVNLMGGTINVESAVGCGSVFTVLLPAIVSTEKAASADFDGADTPDVPAAGEGDEGGGDKELVLIVEDNPDMQAYIRTVLKNTYDTASASNGAEGFTRAVELMPDIILSDVMMPVMDGIQFYSKLKSDERTRHIPVIILSAVNDENQIAESFKMGVEGYLTKPFSPAVLTAKIGNVLSRYKESRDESVAGVNAFTAKLVSLINSKLSDHTLGVDTLAAEMGISPAHLSRKTKENCDMTPYSLIIKMRMDLAVRLIKESDLNISEIAFKCGYQELSNFSRAFTKYWDESPTHMIKKMRSRSL